MHKYAFHLFFNLNTSSAGEFVYISGSLWSQGLYKQCLLRHSNDTFTYLKIIFSV